jgi:hypothetical protein
MKLSKESADAFRLAVRILSSISGPQERKRQVINLENFLAEGKWIPTFSPPQIARLYFPSDEASEKKLLTSMRCALAAGELHNSGLAGESYLLSSDLIAWPECPLVPSDSPLRHWLPEFMHMNEQSSISTKETTKERRHRWLRCIEEGAPETLAKLHQLELKINPKADRSHMGKQIKQAKDERDHDKRNPFVISQKVINGKRVT